MMRAFLIFVLLLPLSAVAQTADEQTYAEIRAELDLLKEQIAGLRNELIQATPRETGVANAGPLVVRVDQLEEEMRTLTGQVEQLRFRIDSVVADGTNRIGDLEFRLLELEGGDFSTLGEPRPLGEDVPAAVADAPLALPQDREQVAGVGGQLTETLRPRPRQGTAAVVETAAVTSEPPAPAPLGFDEALAAYRSGRYTDAIVGLDAYIQANPGGAQASEAMYWKGEALAAQGSWNLAARSYLNAFSGAPDGSKAPESLLRLGVSLGRLGQFEEACLTLAEVTKRYPNAGGDLVSRTTSEQRALNCT